MKLFKFDPKVFIKTILAYSINKDDRSEVLGVAYINLYERASSKERSMEVFGRWSGSAAAVATRAAVDAWVYGGEIPAGMQWEDITPPKPRKDLPTHRPKKLNAAKDSNIVQFSAKVA